MRIGISLTSIHLGATDTEAATWTLERARAAASAGLSCLTIGDHHATGPAPYVQNVPMLGRLLAEWDDRPAGCLFLVPAWNPVLLAEQVGTLAAIAPGPFIVQTGLGSRQQAAAMGIHVGHLGRRLEAGIRVAQALLRGERVDDDVFGLRDVAIAPRPRRGLEWWIGAGAPAALDRAARLGDGWYGDAGAGPGRAAEQLAAYRDACDRVGRPVGRTVVRQDVLIADDGAVAERAGQALIDAGYRGGTPREAVAFGSVEAVAEQLAVYGEAGFTDVIIRAMHGVPQPEAVRSIELAGEVAARVAEV